MLLLRRSVRGTADGSSTVALLIAISAWAAAPSAQAAEPAVTGARAEGEATQPARAAVAPAQGHVLAVQASDLILDLSECSGLGVGRRIELWRPIRLRHPVTGRTIEDRFRIGSLTLTQVRPHLSLAVPDGALGRSPQPGDFVIVEPESRVASAAAADTSATSAAPLASPLPSSPGSPSDDAALSRLFDTLRGSTPEQRIAAYSAFGKAHPHHRHGTALQEQTQQLRELLRARATERRASELARHEPPEHALVGQALSLSVQLGAPRPGLLLHYKPSPAATFHTLTAARAGNGFFVATLPGAAVRDGGLRYFMETVDAAGKSHALVGTAEAPMVVATRRNWMSRRPSGRQPPRS